MRVETNKKVNGSTPILIKFMVRLCLVMFSLGIPFFLMVFIVNLDTFGTGNPAHQLAFMLLLTNIIGWVASYEAYQIEEKKDNLEFAEIEEDTLICGNCGSDNISQVAKVNPNTLELDEFFEECLFDEPYYCNNEDCLVETFEEATSYKA